MASVASLVVSLGLPPKDVAVNLHCTWTRQINDDDDGDDDDDDDDGDAIFLETKGLGEEGAL